MNNIKTFLYNLGYYIRETGRIIRLNLLSNLVSILGTSLILFLFGMVMAGGEIGNRLVTMLNDEAEISAYFKQDLSPAEAQLMTDKIKIIDGVRDVRLVDQAEAQERMRDILGEEASILELFDDNPFEAYIEVRIHIESMDAVLGSVKDIEGIEYVRDNRAVLEQIKRITGALRVLGYLVTLAVGITTVIIVSHMIRQGIYNNREQINTLRLLGAPNGFIGFPYVLAGLLLTLVGGALAAVSILFLLRAAYTGIGGTIPFLPLPPREELGGFLAVLLITVSFLLGFFGSLLGLSSIKDSESNR